MHPSRATFLLVHGAWYGSWVWQKLIPLLEGVGYQVLAPDLPGAGQDRTPLSAITFASYVNRILDLVDRAKESMILVGHGFSGTVISQVAEARPEKIRHLCYLSALLPRNGETALATQTAYSSQGTPTVHLRREG